MKQLEPQPCYNPPPQRRLRTHYLRDLLESRVSFPYLNVVSILYLVRHMAFE